MSEELEVKEAPVEEVSPVVETPEVKDYSPYAELNEKFNALLAVLAGHGIRVS